MSKFKQVEPELAEIARKVIDDFCYGDRLSNPVVIARPRLDRLEQAIADALFDVREKAKCQKS